jgi:multiple sugar transport system ATP-binding protein
MNFVPATLADGATRIAAAGFSVPVPEALRAAVAGRDGARVVMGVRPENLAPPGREPRGASAPVPVTVEIVEPLGNEMVVHARAGQDTLTFKQDPHHATAVGSPLELRLELDATHLFDATTERRLGA